MNLRHRIIPSAIIFLGILLGLASPSHALILFGSDGEGGNPDTRLYTLNTSNGSIATTIGPVGFAVAGLAFHPTTGILYGSTAGQGVSPGSLIRIDTSTGAGTLLGGFGFSGGGTMTDIAFDSDGTLYGWSSSRAGSDLHRINIATGAAVKVGEAGFNTTGGGLAISASGQIFLSASVGGTSGLYSVNKTTGAAALIANLTGGPIASGAYAALAFDENSTLVGVNLIVPEAGGAANLVTIHTANGGVSNLGVTVNGLDAIAFQPLITPVPEPSTAGLLAIGVVAILARRVRRRSSTTPK